MTATESTTPTSVGSTSTYTAPPMSPISISIADAIRRLDVGASIQNAIENLDVPDANRFIFSPPRASTAPPASLRRQPSFLSIKSTKSTPLRASSTRSARFSRAGGVSSRGAGVKPSLGSKKRGSQFSGIDKDMSAEKRASMIMARHRSNLESVLASPIEEKTPSPVLKKATTSVMPWRKKPKGETMSMLIDSGFFPVQEYIYKKDEYPSSASSPSKRNQLALNILVKDLPLDRPSSILKTPTEFYHGNALSLRRSVRNNHGKSFGSRRRILNAASVSSSQISPTTIVSRTLDAPPLSPSNPASPMTPLTPTKALATLTGGTLLPPSPSSPRSGQPSPGILEVIPEDGNIFVTPTSTPPIRSTPTPEAPALPEPIASEIHLNSGTILTVQTPEMTAWKRSVYIQGPIKLPSPAIVPRKDSIATLEPFQDSLTNVPIPRRKSEDAAADDICSWYGSWNHEAVSFAFDAFDADLVADWAMTPVPEEPESPIDTVFKSSNRTPPLAQEIAAAMIGDTVIRPESQAIKPKPLNMPTVPLPDLPKAASLLDAGKGHSRNSSGDASFKSLSSGSEPLSRPDSRGSGISGVSSVEEKSWFESEDKRDKRRGSSEGLKAKPKMSRMRRFVQTASAIL